MGETSETTAPITKKHKGRPENLRPWPKGVFGNPGGIREAFSGRRPFASFANAPRVASPSSSS